MLIKGVLLFLLAMVAIGMVGNVLFPGALRRRVRRGLTINRPGSCSHCGRPMIGRTCDCGRKV